MIYARNKRTKEHEIADMTAPYGFDWEFLQTDKQGWIPHEGESCPLPNDAKCSVLLSGEESGAKDDILFAAGNLRWTHNGTQWDIVAYRPVLESDRKKLLEELAEDLTEWPSTHLFIKWDCGSFSATDNHFDDGIVFTRDEWLAARGDWDGKTWPPKEGTRVRVREGDYQPGTVVGVGEAMGDTRIAVKTDCGKLLTYTGFEGVGAELVKPLRSAEDEAVDSMLADAEWMDERGFDVSTDETFARALYRMGWRKW